MIYKFGRFSLHSDLPLPLNEISHYEDGLSVRTHLLTSPNVANGHPSIIVHGSRTFVYNLCYGKDCATIREGKYADIYLGTTEKIAAEWLLFSKVLPIAHIQRNGEVLHASSLEINGKAILFCGDSGAGKSTLAAFLSLQQGFSILGDDVAPLIRNGKRWSVVSTSSYARLADQSAEALCSAPSIKLHQKGFFKASHNEHSCGREFEVLKIYVLQSGDSLQLQPLSGYKKLLAILHTLWFLPLHQAVQGQDHLQRIAHLAKSFDVTVLTIPRSYDALHKVVPLLRKDLLHLDPQNSISAS